MPGVAETVLYHPRAGEVRQGRKTVPAIVLKVDESNRLLELLVIHSSDDMITQDKVPQQVEGDRGWSRLPGVDVGNIDLLREQMSALEKRIDLLVLAITGDFLVPAGETVMSLIDKLDERIAAIEERPVGAPLSAAPAKRRRGRPAKS